MKKEDKDLLLQDLSARLPYGVKVEIIKNYQSGIYTLYPSDIDSFKHNFQDIKPYLRPMSSMTEEEIRALGARVKINPAEGLDYLNANHFDYRGLIPMGLAIEAPKDMYNFNKEE